MGYAIGVIESVPQSGQGSLKVAWRLQAVNAPPASPSCALLADRASPSTRAVHSRVIQLQNRAMRGRSRFRLRCGVCTRDRGLWWPFGMRVLPGARPPAAAAAVDAVVHSRPRSAVPIPAMLSRRSRCRRGRTTRWAGLRFGVVTAHEERSSWCHRQETNDRIESLSAA